MSLALRALMMALGVALALAAWAQWTAARGTAVGAALGAQRDGLPAAAETLERAARLWPARADAAYERAVVALRQGDAEASLAWLVRCEGRIASRLRWLQMAANAHQALGHTSEVNAALSDALALAPDTPARDWHALANLRQRSGQDTEATAARARAALSDR